MASSRRPRNAAALPSPLVVLAQKRLMLLDLGLQFPERDAHADSGIGACAGSMQSARGERKIHREPILGGMGLLLKTSVQLNQVRLVGLQQGPDLAKVALNGGFQPWRRFDLLVADGSFHLGT
jgi:hypothetical protein